MISKPHSTYLEPLGSALVIREVVEKLDIRDGVLPTNKVARFRKPPRCFNNYGFCVWKGT